MILSFIYSFNLSLALSGKLDYKIISSLFYVKRKKVFFSLNPLLFFWPETLSLWPIQALLLKFQASF